MTPNQAILCSRSRCDDYALRTGSIPVWIRTCFVALFEKDAVNILASKALGVRYTSKQGTSISCNEYAKILQAISWNFQSSESSARRQPVCGKYYWRSSPGDEYHAERRMGFSSCVAALTLGVASFCAITSGLESSSEGPPTVKQLTAGAIRVAMWQNKAAKPMRIQ
jgi:hypothetical protein